MGLFTKKKLSDAERQAWSAQLLEVRAAELLEFGDTPQFGDNWDAHDAEWMRLFYEEYLPQYGVAVAAPMMAADGLRLSGYRKFLEGTAMLMIADEVEDGPVEWSPTQVYWCITSDETDANGAQIWGYQLVADDWSSAKSYMKARVDEWGLENTRKTNQLWKDAWNRYYKWIAIAIIAIVVIIVLAPVIAGVALGVVLGETISVAGALAAGSAALAGSGMLASATGWLDNAGDLFESAINPVDELYQDSAAQFNENRSVLINEITEDSNSVPVFQPDGDLILMDNAPTDSVGDSSSSLIPLLLAAAGYLVFI